MNRPSTETALTVAVRQWHEPAGVRAETTEEPPAATPHPPFAKWPTTVLVFDNETTTDRVQHLTFGWYRYTRWQPDGSLRTLEEGILYAEDLPERDPTGFAELQRFARDHLANLRPAKRGPIQIRNRRGFLNEVLWPAIQADALVVGFNLPFDLSRLAVSWGETRRHRKRTNGGPPPADVFARGFSLVLWEYQDKATGAWKEHSYRPRVRIKHLDNKRAFIGLGPCRKRDRRDPHHPGRFLDLKTLVFALTNRGHSLASACAAFGIVEGKASPERHGTITSDYVAYAQQDVRATLLLLERLRQEFDRHPIELLPDRAQSPASIAKAYLAAMGITPLLDRAPHLPRPRLGNVMSAYYGGRTESRIRRTPMPVVYVDFLSMYPTVNSLMELWRFVTAERITTVDVTTEVQALLDDVTKDAVFDPAFWPRLTFFAQIVPKGDFLPVRANYSGGSFTIGVNALAADRPLWYAGPDLVASALLAGRAPRVLQAIRLVPQGTLSTLRPVKLGGEVLIDPRRDDFFRFVIEERKRLGRAARRRQPPLSHLDQFFKVLANSGGYGIFAELNRQELPENERVPVSVYGATDAAFVARTNAPELPGRTCFPPLAALITSAARLMLALLEREVTDRRGSYTFCDTDSMAIVATETGGLVPCLGGPYVLPDGRPAVRALPRSEIDEIVDRFASLNPYDRAVVPGSVLEVENVNFDPETAEQRQLWCFSISAKRYALFTRDEDGAPEIVEDGYSEHGLGHLLNPNDAASDSREWIRTVWTGFVSEALGQPFTWPDWLDRPAMSRITASSPRVLRTLARSHHGTYADGPKPFNFLISPYVAPYGHPVGVDPQYFHLIAPYAPDARQWTKLSWTDHYSGTAFAISTKEGALPERTARVQSYRDVIGRYRTHPEAKSLDAKGPPANRRTVGLLHRRPVALGELVYIGKETNRLEDVEQGLVHDWDEVQLVFREPKVVRPTSFAPCAACGASLPRTRMVYCSPACRQRAYRRRLASVGVESRGKQSVVQVEDRVRS